MSRDPYAAPDDARVPESVIPSNPSPEGEFAVPPSKSPDTSPDSPRKYKIGVAAWVAVAVAIFAILIVFAVL
jgi:hypothetical protein